MILCTSIDMRIVFIVVVFMFEFFFEFVVRIDGK